MRLPYTIVTLQTSFIPLLLKGGGEGGMKSVAEVTVNSKEEFCTNYVQEFGLRIKEEERQER